VVGQSHLLGPDGPLTQLARHPVSTILWGPPGVGKTTLARLIAAESGLHFEQISAIFTGVADLRRVFDAARLRHRQGRQTLLFVDEIHRFNKAQQDGFLPHMEDGAIVLIGATTENPSFELNAAVLSRSQVLRLERLDDAAVETLLARAEAETGHPLPLTPEGRAALVAMADGDGRAALNLAEAAFDLKGGPFDAAGLSDRLARRAAHYDKTGDQHYNLISALHKSVRGSDPDAALYWFARMLQGGEDPRYLARRLIRMASEDIGLADPDALRLTLAARDAYDTLGSPEGELALAEAVVHLALAPKSNAVYAGFKAAMAAAKATGSLPPPMHILNAPTRMMKDQGFGAGYAYDHDDPDGFSGQNYFPDGMKRGAYYLPIERGFERELRKRVDFFAKLRARKASES
jgi:putative ATPase